LRPVVCQRGSRVHRLPLSRFAAEARPVLRLADPGLAATTAAISGFGAMVADLAVFALLPASSPARPARRQPLPVRPRIPRLNRLPLRDRRKASRSALRAAE